MQTPISWVGNLKGQCHEIFRFWFFSWTSFPQASAYTIRTVSNFFENSRRYSQLRVCHRCQRHRWQMEKTFKQKNFNNFVWTPLGSTVELTYIYIFAFKFTLRWLQPDIVAIVANLPPVSLTPVANLPPVSTTLAKIGGKICHRCRRWFRWQICHRCRWYRWCTLTREYLGEFSKKFETV